MNVCSRNEKILEQISCFSFDHDYGEDDVDLFRFDFAVHSFIFGFFFFLLRFSFFSKKINDRVNNRVIYESN